MSDGIGKTKPKKASPWIRRAVQVFFVLLVIVMVAGEPLAEQGLALPAVFEGASLHAICPFGGVVSFWQLATTGTITKKAHESSVALAVIALVLAVLFGPVVCGWICPFGTVQEWLGSLGRRVFGRKYNNFLPRKVDGILRYLRYAVLVWVIYMTAVTGKLAFQDYDPYYVLFNFWSDELAVSGIVILLATIALSLFVERPFCKYACPYGAFQGIFNLIRIFGVKRSPSTCIHCKACDKACPMNIEVSSSGTVRDHQCITCLACTSEHSCPVESTVVLAAGSVDSAEKKEAV